MLDIRRLRLLRELAHRGTIVAVAQALAFTPSAVSQQLSALEREAGLPLLERSGRRVVLTPAGRNLVRHAEAVLEQLERAASELASARQGLTGPLRIGTFPSAGRTIIPAALTALAREHPGLEPMVAEIDPAGVADAIRAGELEVALIHEYDFVASRPEPGLATEGLCTEAMYLASAAPPAAEPHLPPTSAVPADPAAIGRCRDAPWITATPGTMCQQMTIHACPDRVGHPRRVDLRDHRLKPGVVPGQSGQRGRDHRAAGAGKGADAQWAGQALARAGQFGGGPLQLFEHGLGVPDQVLPGRGEHHPPPAAFQQGQARLPFERAELLRDGRRGEGKGLGDGDDSAAVGQFPQQAQAADIQHQFSLNFAAQMRTRPA